MLVHLADAGYAVHLLSSESTRDGAVDVVPETDAALDLLAEAGTGDDGELDLLVHAAHAPASQGGLVVAVLVDRDEEAVRRVASLRQPGSTGLAVVLDTATFGDREPRAGAATQEPSGDAGAYAEMLRLAGWHAVTVTAGQRVAPVWQSLTARGWRPDDPGAGRRRGRRAAGDDVRGLRGDDADDAASWLAPAFWCSVVVVLVGAGCAGSPPAARSCCSASCSSGRTSSSPSPSRAPCAAGCRGRGPPRR